MAASLLPTPPQAAASPASGYTDVTKARETIRRNTGFTLLEVLVAIVIMAVIMTTAFGALRLGGRSWEAGVTRASDNESFRAVADLLRRQVSQVIDMRWEDGTEKRIAFAGTSGQLHFVAPAPRQYRRAGLFEYGLIVQRDGQDTNLLLSFVPFNPDAEAFQTPARDQLLRLVGGLQSVSFDYFGNPGTTTGRASRARKNTQPPRWHRRWDADAQQYPDLIRIRMEVNEGQQPWPDLYLVLPAGRDQ